jgi:hypothetical protein
VVITWVLIVLKLLSCWEGPIWFISCNLREHFGSDHRSCDTAMIGRTSPSIPTLLSIITTALNHYILRSTDLSVAILYSPTWFILGFLSVICETFIRGVVCSYLCVHFYFRFSKIRKIVSGPLSIIIIIYLPIENFLGPNILISGIFIKEIKMKMNEFLIIFFQYL